MNADSTVDYSFMLLAPLALILLGGLCVMADVALLKRRGDSDSVSSFVDAGLRPRPGLRLASVFLFTLSAVITTRDLLSLLHNSSIILLSAWFGVVSTIIAFLILLFGILLPRALGELLYDCRPISALSRVVRLLTIWIDPLAELGWVFVAGTLRLLHLDRRRSAERTEKDVLEMMDQGLESGAFDATEKKMVKGVLDLDEHTVAELMTPRSRVTWLDLDDLDEVNWRRMAAAGHSDYPVFQGNHDNVRGMVSVKSLWGNVSMTGSVKLADVLTQPLFVPSTMTAPRLIDEYRKLRRHVALVVDEFGVVEGMVTLKDVVEAIIGRLPERGVRHHYPEIIFREEGSWIVDAMLDYDETAKEIGLVVSEGDSVEVRYQTIGGFVLHYLGHIPEEGEKLERNGFRFEIVGMDRQRIDKLLVTRLPAPLPDLGSKK